MHFSDSPPQSQSALPRLRYFGHPELGKPGRVLILTPPRWIFVHWKGERGKRRSRGCDAANCPPDWHGETTNSTGFAPALLTKRNAAGKIVGLPIVLEIKASENERLRRLLSGLGPWPIVAEKRGVGVFDFALAIQQQCVLFPPPEPAFDILPSLRRLWGIREVAVATEPTILEYRKPA
jgi:hypothetical protein